jgi:hypothetical protein
VHVKVNGQLNVLLREFTVPIEWEDGLILELAWTV